MLPRAITKLCFTCRRPFETRWVRQKYCSNCGGAAAAATGRKFSLSRAAAKSPAIKEIHRTRGLRENAPLASVFERPVYEWFVTFRVPYSLASSKNRRWSLSRGGTVFLTQEVREYSAMVQAVTKNALRAQVVKQNKVWLSFFVEKENNKADAINVVDTMCDAIKLAIGLDDRWFCIDQVDWAIRKSSPQIIVRIGQASPDDVIACSHCGQLLGLDNFTKSKDLPLGRSRACRGCSAIITKHAAVARKKAKGFFDD